ncbi:hypothetical protein PR048_023113 [Dryococelus australis]|uniref:Uncharacterized protein n=1 Tax=Dryococelus australis TaxID=614101 RepID=A0ABQ9GT66_9NEOP|nr:hypothetical protein PR048_023113 [Dryococelus australis]
MMWSLAMVTSCSATKPALQQRLIQRYFIFHLDDAPPHWHLAVRGYLNETLQQRWIGHRADGDHSQALHHWPPKSPYLTPYVKNQVFRPPLPANIDNLKTRITDAIQTITLDMLTRVWNEFEYRVDVSFGPLVALMEADYKYARASMIMKANTNGWDTIQESLVQMFYNPPRVCCWAGAIRYGEQISGNLRFNCFLQMPQCLDLTFKIETS